MLQYSLQNPSHGKDAAVAVDLHGILRRVASGPSKKHYQHLIDDLLSIHDKAVMDRVGRLFGKKSGKDTPTVIIKATDDASYMNLIDALDEMQICNIGKYVITDIAEADEFLIKNFDAKGGLSQNLADN